MSRITLRNLITSPDGLGYCCLWFFFKRYKSTSLIATRLGVSERAVRYAKASVTNGNEGCVGCANCMKGLLVSDRVRD